MDLIFPNYFFSSKSPALGINCHTFEDEQIEAPCKEDSEIDIDSECEEFEEPKSEPTDPDSKYTDILKNWILSPDHFFHPYPSAKDKKMLQEKTGLSGPQLKNWFTNARRRSWRPLVRTILNECNLNPILEKARLQHAVPDVSFECGELLRCKDGNYFQPKVATEVLKAWIISSSNFIHPYPRAPQRLFLIRITGLTSTQLRNWFTNDRRRIWKPVMQKVIERIDLQPILEEAIPFYPGLCPAS